MHVRIPFLLALATGALADFGYEVFSDPKSVCAGDDKSKFKGTSGDEAKYSNCQSVENTDSKWMAFKGEAPDGWRIEVYGQPDCDGNWLTVRPGECFHAVTNKEVPDPHEIKSFQMFKR